MKKRLLAILLGTMMIISLTGCGGETTVLNVNVENSETLHDTTLGINSLIEIGNGLWYDSSTRIVYWWNGALSDPTILSSRFMYASTTPSPYYAPNGLPYKYNPETNTFEEIDIAALLTDTKNNTDIESEGTK